MLPRDNTVNMLREFVELVLDDNMRRQLGQSWAVDDTDMATPRRFATTVVAHHRNELLDVIDHDDRLKTQWQTYQRDGLAGVQALWESERRVHRTAVSVSSMSFEAAGSQSTSVVDELQTIDIIEVVTKSPIQQVPLEKIIVRDINVRVTIEDDPNFSELVTSIEQHGLLQPIVIVLDPENPQQWRLLAGERRYRAVQTLGWSTILAHIVDVPESAWKIVMLTENIQRQDLTPWEEALGYQQLLDSGLSLRQLAKQLHKSPGYLSGLLKLLRNPLIRQAMYDRRLEARSIALELAPLIDAEGQEKIANTVESVLKFIVAKRPTVMQLREYITRQLVEPSSLPKDRISVEKPGTPRGSFLKKEVARLDDIQKIRADRLSPEELAVLADLYDRTAQALRARLESPPNAAERATIE